MGLALPDSTGIVQFSGEILAIFFFLLFWATVRNSPPLLWHSLWSDNFRQVIHHNRNAQGRFGGTDTVPSVTGDSQWQLTLICGTVEYPAHFQEPIGKMVPWWLRKISLCPFLPDLCPLPDHGADIAALHLAKAEQEALLYTFGELVFGDGGEPEGLVKRDQDDG